MLGGLLELDDAVSRVTPPRNRVKQPLPIPLGVYIGHTRILLQTPVDELWGRLNELGAAEAHQQPVIVYCAVGVRGHTAARILAQAGWDVRNLDGGYTTWAAGTGQGS